MGTKTIAYLRVSTDKQADKGVSLDAQRAKVAAYAELVTTSQPVDAIASRHGISRRSLYRLVKTGPPK